VLVGFILALYAAACTPETALETTTGGPDPIETAMATQVVPRPTPETEPAPTPLDPEDSLVRDAAALAESEGLDLEEAVRRMEFQATIGDIQPALMADLPETYAGLWVEHKPQYRIVISLTEGDRSTIQPYITGKAWADFVEVRLATYSLAELMADQAVASKVGGQLNLALSTALDVMGNRVELIVGNPQLFQADLAAAGLTLPESVAVIPINADEPPPGTNRGDLIEVQTAGEWTIYLPNQPPTASSMAALIEGQFIEVDGCLRVTDDDYETGFLVLWPSNTDIRIAENEVEVLNDAGQVVARTGESLRLGGGAIESSTAQASFDKLIPGLSQTDCSGPYWVAGKLETLVEQAVADLYVSPFSSDGRILAIFMEQSRPSQIEGKIAGELTVDGQGCMHVGDYVVFWPPGAYLREEPLRVFDAQGLLLGQVGGTVELRGSEKGSEDYRYFENKVNCPGPYWGVGEVRQSGES